MLNFTLLADLKTRFFFVIDHLADGPIRRFLWAVIGRLIVLIRKCRVKGSQLLRYRGGFFEILTPYGKLRFVYNPCDDIDLALKEYTKHYTLKPGDVVVDAGAYQGVTTIIFALIVGETGKVIAFEPDAHNRMALQKNLLANTITNVLVVPKGLWSTNCKLGFISDRNVASAIQIVNKDKGTATTSIDVVTLDSELERWGITNVNFIKMDIEGAENEAIKGIRRLSQENRLCLSIASYHRVNNEKTYLFLERELPGLGFIDVVTEKDFAGYEITFSNNNPQ